jgi:hypothetical protein
MKLPAHEIGGTVYPSKTETGGWQNRVYIEVGQKANWALGSESDTRARRDQCGMGSAGGANAGE